MYLFELWREFKISLAEIFSFFTNSPIVFISEKVLILDRLTEKEVLEFAQSAGWVIKISKINKKLWKATKMLELFDYLAEEIEDNGKWKIDYGVNLFWEKSYDLKRLLLDLKKQLKARELSTRFVNQNFMNLSSAIINGEKLVAKWMDFNIVTTKSEVFIGKTIWVQDINSYSKRDYGKKRDMDTGMLPPKLAQTMIHLAVGNKKPVYIYDPFCGLWTVLIESVLAGNIRVFWSDLNDAMVDATTENLEFIKKEFSLHNFKSDIFPLNATNIAESEAIKFWKIDAIVSEGYLGTIFTHDIITEERVKEERRKLAMMYESFFAGLKKARYSWVIVMSFPFWEIKRTYAYFDEIYTILKKYCSIEKMLPSNDIARESKVGSLLYKREKQVVGREIFKLRIK